MSTNTGINRKRKLASSAGRQASPKQTKLQAQRRRAKKAKRAVDVDALPWRTVEVPEMYDDAEGFFGLEEVEGVDVIRNGDTLQFITAVASEAESEEFVGFSDSPLPSRPTKTSKPAPKATKKPSRQSEEKEQASKRGNTSRVSQDLEDTELVSGGFQALQELQQGDEEVDTSAWLPLGLLPQILSCLSRLKFAKPTAIQSAAIPEILAGHDVIGKASTGSGKTLAFAIPIVNDWIQAQEGSGDEVSKTPLALIISPTRELAHQITSHIKDLCTNLPAPPQVCSVTGGLSVYKQQRQLETANIVVGTPGRLWEVLSSSKALMSAFKGIKFLVVDEADRLLSEGHFKDAEEILSALDRTETGGGKEEQAPMSRQTLVFSATFNQGLQQKLAGKGRYDLMTQAQSMEYLLKRLNFREDVPKFLDVNPVSQMAEGLKEGLVECGAMEKDLYLYALLMLQPMKRALVFTNSISCVRRLAPMLQNLNVPAFPLHSQMPQKARLRSVERFTASKPGMSSILIATDVAARGLDIPGIDVIIHYHVPRTADAYVHRSGRTARAEKSGLSILLSAPEEVVSTRRLIAKIHAASKARARERGHDRFLRTIDIDRRVVSRLKDRLDLAKKIADTTLAKEKGGKDDDWMRAAAEDLGVDYDSADMEKAGKWGGRGSGRKEKEKQARELSKAEVGVLRSQLKQLLSQRVNTGVSEKYITNGNVDIDELLRGTKGEFLGRVNGLDLDDL